MGSRSDFTKKLAEWQRKAREKAEELDSRYQIRSKVEQGVKVAEEATGKLADAVIAGVGAAKETAQEIDREFGVSEKVKDTSQQAGEAVKDAAEKTKEKASEFFGDAREYYEYASGAYDFGARAAKITSSLTNSLLSAKGWIRENPGKTAVVTLSMIAGIRTGSALPGLNVSILGIGGTGHWFFHSALVPYGLRKLTERYDEYLKDQEKRLAAGELDEAERARVEFQRDALKYVGAPLLGTFSVAAGTALLYEAFTGGIVAGGPVSLILGGNPFLNSVWLFGNGVVCLHNGYKFFMIALADQEEVERLVREVKGLLPEAVTV